jgi:type I restriction enzyme S subunit
MLTQKGDIRYFFYELLAARQELQSWGQGSTFMELASAKLGAVQIAQPPLEEQQAVAGFLDRETSKIDALITKREQLIALLEEKRTALISHAVTKGLDTSVSMKDSGFPWASAVPGHWHVLPFKRFVRSMCDGPFGSDMKSVHYSEQGVRLIRLQNIALGKFDDSDEAYISESHFLSLPGHDAIPGDLLVAGLGDQNHPVGRACILPGSVREAMVKADCFRVRLNGSRLLHMFAMYFLCSQPARAAVGTRMRGATRDRMNLTGLGELPILIPPIEEQEAIASYLEGVTEKIDDIVFKCHEAIEKLQEFRTALISAAVTGRIDVRGEVS